MAKNTKPQQQQQQPTQPLSGKSKQQKGWNPNQGKDQKGCNC